MLFYLFLPYIDHKISLGSLFDHNQISNFEHFRAAVLWSRDQLLKNLESTQLIRLNAKLYHILSFAFLKKYLTSFFHNNIDTSNFIALRELDKCPRIKLTILNVRMLASNWPS